MFKSTVFDLWNFLIKLIKQTRTSIELGTLITKAIKQ